MYTKTSYNTLFFGTVMHYFKDGKEIGYKNHNGLQIYHPDYEPTILTRNQAFKYWDKHFHNRPCWMLPALLEALVATTDDNAYGYIHNGEIVIRENDNWYFTTIKG